MKTVEQINGHSFIVIDPRGVEHEVKNVQEFVQNNYELFDSDDDVIKRKSPEHEDGRKAGGYWTRADRGLRRVIEGESPSWKGWRLKS